MSSCLGSSEFTVVVWKINTGLKHFPPILESKPFLLLGSERKLQLRLWLEDFGYQARIKLCLIPRLNSSEKETVFHVITYFRDGNDLSFSDISSTNNIDVIWSFNRQASSLPGICEIICLFRCVLPITESSPESETICFGPLDSSLQSVSSDFGHLLEDKTFADVTLKCSDRAISAHRAVLSARSPVFAAMFRNKMAECEDGIVEFKDLDPDTLESFLQYLYSGRIAGLSENNVCTIFSTADKYSVPSLQQECSRWIGKRLTRENYICYLQLADAHNYEDLINGVAEFIARNSSVLTSDEWSQFKEVNPKPAISVYERYITLLSTAKSD